MRTQLRATGTSALALVTLAMQACDGGTHLRRMVHDAKGRPVAGAIASLAALDRRGQIRAADTAVTQSNGFFELWVTHSPYRQQLVLRVEYAGFQPFERRFMAGDTSAVPRPIVLEEVTQP